MSLIIIGSIWFYIIENQQYKFYNMLYKNIKKPLNVLGMF